MTLYNFDEYVDRRGSDCKKYASDVCPEDVLPMWIADTDFKVPVEVEEAAKKRVDHACFGYPTDLPEFNKSFQGWLKRRHGWEVKEEDIVFATGVIPAVIFYLRAFTQPGDQIVVNTPLYPPLREAVVDNGRILKESSLIKKGDEYGINWQEMEDLFKDPRTTMFFLCNPHNPIGKVYCREDLEKLSKLCLKYHVLVFSDEIHSDIIIDKNKKHIPFASLNKETADITCTGYNPGKAFNVAGVRTAACVITNPVLRERFLVSRKNNKAMGRTILGQNVFIACYENGDAYVDQLIDYLNKNYAYLKESLAKDLPQLGVSVLEGTYLVWLDFSKYTHDHEELIKCLEGVGKIKLNDGRTFGKEGDLHMRINIAVPFRTLEDGINRIKKAVKALEK